MSQATPEILTNVENELNKAQSEASSYIIHI